VICSCACHSKKLGRLAEVVEPEANATTNNQPSMEIVQR
jgi:hypothetical protein